MKYRLVNDCSHYHAGSALVAVQIRRLLKERGFVEAEDADTVVINGEGTFHHDSPSALRIIEAVRKHRGTKTIHFVNAVWQNMGSAIPDVAVASLRETLSFTEFKSRHPTAQSYVSPDISLTYDWRDQPQRADRLLVFDSVSDQTTQVLRQVSDKLGARFVRMCEFGRDYVGLLNLVASHRAVITGRYHGAMFAAITGTPLLCAPSNTWKTRGFLSDVGIEGAFFKTEEDLAREARRGNFATIPAPKIEAARSTWEEVFSKMAEIASPPSVPVRADASCVLVGNGPSLLSKRIGSIIDAHDEVVRFNSFRTKGFTHHTGSRTTLWSTFGKGTQPEDPSAFEKLVFIHGDSGGPSVSGKQVFRIPASFYQKLRSDIRAISNHKNAKTVNPTSGFLVANWLLHSGVKRVHLAGFDHFSKVSSQAHHYWEPKAYGRPDDHDGDAERVLLTPWVLAGRLAYLT